LRCRHWRTPAVAAAVAVVDMAVVAVVDTVAVALAVAVEDLVGSVAEEDLVAAALVALSSGVAATGKLSFAALRMTTRSSSG
jgi:hypothetical protein